MKSLIIFILLGLSLTYKPEDAVSYARTHCAVYSKSYSDLSKEGGDSANFVSQCLKAGGLDLSNCGVKTDKHGSIHKSADLKSCLTKKGWHSSTSLPSGFKGGYPMFRTSNSHALIATIVSGTTVYYCSHTDDHCDAILGSGVTYFYPK